MKLCVALAFICVTLPAVYGIRCYFCTGVARGDCQREYNCETHYDRCASTSIGGKVDYECMRRNLCSKTAGVGVQCCSGDLCNGAKTSAVFVPLLLAPLAIITLFI